MIVDVRTKEEFEEGHLDGAQNIPLEDILNDSLHCLESFSKEEQINLCCKSGGRSERARQKLLSLGFINVSNIGAMDSYKNDKNRGFVGLLALLISVAIIMILMFGSNKAPKQYTNDEIVVEEGKGVIETQLETVKKADDVKKMIESREYDFE